MSWFKQGQSYLDPSQAAKVYDRIGRLQDTQVVYEGAAVDDLVAAARFEEATDVLEIGCGTGALALDLLTSHLPATATYVGLDVSHHMVEIASSRLREFAGRAEVIEVDGGTPWASPDASHDRVLATYVLDLLSPVEIDTFFSEARRVLRPGGLVAVVGLTPGTGLVSKAVSAVWTRAWQASPHLTGGCRPLDLEVPDGWTVLHDATVTSWGISSRSLVLTPQESKATTPPAKSD